MAEAQEGTGVSAAANRILNENYLRLRTRSCTLLLWERLLTDEDRDRLGGDINHVVDQHTAISLWRALHPVSLGRAVIDLAARLNLIDRDTREWLLREIKETGSPEDVLDEALRSARLVLRESPREVYWDGDLIPIEWDRHRSPWNYIATLCEHAVEGKPIDSSHFGERYKPGYHSKLRGRTTSLPKFPLDLANLIVSAGSGQHRLDLPPRAIRVLQLSVREVAGVF